MTRPSQLLHPQREPAAPLLAATVLLVRSSPSDGALEVLMTRRAKKASFAPNAYVFPGGGVEAQDADPATHTSAARRLNQSDEQLTHALAAIRESFEEMGILLARHADGRLADASDIAALDRHPTDKAASFAAQCRNRGLLLAADEVFVLARWMGDRNLPRRFDVPFLIARMPAHQTPVADETEQFEPVWVHPQDALERHAAGAFFMIYPTVRTLERLATFESADALLAACANGGPLWTSCPRTGMLAGKEARYMEHESPYGELAMVCPDGQPLHALDWQTARAVPLRKNLLRLTAPNPGVMTGPGTNSYLVGEPATGFIAIDPGPADPAHLEALWRAAGGDIRMIVCTHSHPDHSPGAAPLAALCVQSGRPAPPILGLPSAPTARSASQFTPDRSLQNNELLTLTGQALEGQITHNFQVIYTPGHAANHLCLLLVEDALLFSGDHILNGSTPVIDPPDGNMADYLDSLDRLDALCEAHGVEFILPAHGYVLGGPVNGARGTIAKLTAHRLAREAKVIAALQALPGGSMDDWVAHAYDDVPPRMWPVAQRSLLAHIERIRSRVS